MRCIQVTSPNDIHAFNVFVQQWPSCQKAHALTCRANLHLISCRTFRLPRLRDGCQFFWGAPVAAGESVLPALVEIRHDDHRSIQPIRPIGQFSRSGTCRRAPCLLGGACQYRRQGPELVDGAWSRPRGGGGGVLSLEKGTDCDPTTVEGRLSRPEMALKRRTVLLSYCMIVELSECLQ